MADREIYEAAGFLFPNRIQADEALEEEKKIYFIKSRLKREDAVSVLVVYNKLIKGNVLKTPVGLAFLKSLYDELKADGSIDEKQIELIPYGASYLNGGRVKKDETVEEKNEELAAMHKKQVFMGWVIAMLVICVIAMFMLTLKSENPNIINYETALQNKYSAWEEELKERERVVREKEQEMIDQ